MIMKTSPACDPLVVAVQRAMDALTLMLGAEDLGDPAAARQIVREELSAHLAGRRSSRGARTPHLAREELSDRAILGDIVARAAARLMGKEDLLS